MTISDILTEDEAPFTSYGNEPEYSDIDSRSLFSAENNLFAGKNTVRLGNYSGRTYQDKYSARDLLDDCSEPWVESISKIGGGGSSNVDLTLVDLGPQDRLAAECELFAGDGTIHVNLGSCSAKSYRVRYSARDLLDDDSNLQLDTTTQASINHLFDDEPFDLGLGNSSVPSLCTDESPESSTVSLPNISGASLAEPPSAVVSSKPCDVEAPAAAGEPIRMSRSQRRRQQQRERRILDRVRKKMMSPPAEHLACHATGPELTRPLSEHASSAVTP